MEICQKCSCDNVIGWSWMFVLPLKKNPEVLFRKPQMRDHKSRHPKIIFSLKKKPTLSNLCTHRSKFLNYINDQNAALGIHGCVRHSRGLISLRRHPCASSEAIKREMRHYCRRQTSGNLITKEERKIILPSSPPRVFVARCNDSPPHRRRFSLERKLKRSCKRLASPLEQECKINVG